MTRQDALHQTLHPGVVIFPVTLHHVEVMNFAGQIVQGLCTSRQTLSHEEVFQRQPKLSQLFMHESAVAVRFGKLGVDLDPQRKGF